MRDLKIPEQRHPEKARVLIIHNRKTGMDSGESACWAGLSRNAQDHAGT